jgi:hypothetical protein
MFFICSDDKKIAAKPHIQFLIDLGPDSQLLDCAPTC